MILTAKDLMQREVHTVPMDMTLIEFASFLEEEAIHGAPVVGPKGKVVGVVSYTDLVREVSEERESRGMHPYFWTLEQEVAEFDSEGFTDSFPGGERSVTEIMTHDLVSASPETSAGDLAEMMLDQRVHRILITKEGHLAGIVTATDLLKAVKRYETESARS
ncbi:MAG: CBS domain-containing protein [Planctomycetota bacterium]